MKVIGSISNGKIICEVDTRELKKFFNCYYAKNPDMNESTIDTLRVGQEIDLGKGYDHFSEIQNAFSKTQDFIKAHKPVIEAITSGLLLLSNDATKDGDQ